MIKIGIALFSLSLLGSQVSYASPSTATPSATPSPTATPSTSSSPSPKISAEDKARLIEEWRVAREEARVDLDKSVLVAAKAREAAIIKAKKVKKEEKRLALISKAYKDYLVKAKAARELYYQRLDDAKSTYQLGLLG